MFGVVINKRSFEPFMRSDLVLFQLLVLECVVLDLVLFQLLVLECVVLDLVLFQLLVLKCVVLAGAKE